MTVRSRLVILAAAAAVFFSVVIPASAQNAPSTSAAPTKELVALLEGRLESGMAFLAAKLPDGASHQYVGALYLQSVPQLLVVVAQFEPAVLMDDRLTKRDYREAYTDLNSASKVGSRFFFEDLKVDGLMPSRDGSDPFDMYTGVDGKRLQFDGDAKRQKMSDDEYRAAFVAADALYAKAVQALLVEARKKGS